MLHDELLRPLPGQTLAHLACIVGGLFVNVDISFDGALIISFNMIPNKEKISHNST